MPATIMDKILQGWSRMLSFDVSDLRVYFDCVSLARQEQPRVLLKVEIVSKILPGRVFVADRVT